MPYRQPTRPPASDGPSCMPQKLGTPYIGVLDITRLASSWGACWSPQRDTRKTLERQAERSDSLREFPFAQDRGAHLEQCEAPRQSSTWKRSFLGLPLRSQPSYSVAENLLERALGVAPILACCRSAQETTKVCIEICLAQLLSARLSSRAQRRSHLRRARSRNLLLRSSYGERCSYKVITLADCSLLSTTTYVRIDNTFQVVHIRIF
jgi:hypothetical protein